MKNQTKNAAARFHAIKCLNFRRLLIGAITLGASGAIIHAGAIVAPIAIPTVLVGNTDNVNDTVMLQDGTGYRGAVNYEYCIGVYEVTTTEYVAFLNAMAKSDPYGLYNEKMADMLIEWGCGITRTGDSGNYEYGIADQYAKLPVNFVSLWDAMRFCNWLTTGDTETGVYDFASLARSGKLESTGIPSTSDDLRRNDTAWLEGGVAIASENEWYKAAYYDGETQQYRQYSMIGNLSHDTANYKNATSQLIADGYPIVDVNYFDNNPSAKSSYGTYQQTGNVFEWNDSSPPYRENERIARGGAYYSLATEITAKNSSPGNPNDEDDDLGFRIVSRFAIVPEPQTYALWAGVILGGVIILRRRK